MKNNIILLLSFFSCGLYQASDIFKAIESKNYLFVRKWIRNSPDLTVVNDQGQTLLMKAMEVHNSWLIKQALKHKGIINVVDNCGKTALDYAVESHDSKYIRLLVKKGAKVTSSENLEKAQKIIKRRARICAGIGLVFLGLASYTVYSFVTAPVQCLCCAALPAALALGRDASISIGTLIPAAYWYRQQHKVQIL